MLASCYGYVRAWTRTYHLIKAPLSSVKPWLDAPVTTPALCGQGLPEDMMDWGLVCGALDEGTRVCRRCIRKALKGARGEEAGR